MDFKYNTIEEALDELRNGRIILVTDDPDRENEGDMICAAEFATQANVNFMATYAKGLLCTPMSAALATKLGLPQKALHIFAYNIVLQIHHITRLLF